MSGLLRSQLRLFHSGIRLNGSNQDNTKYLNSYYKMQLSRKYHLYSSFPLWNRYSRHYHSMVLTSSHLTGQNYHHNNHYHHMSLSVPLYNYNGIRRFRVNQQLFENPSSKVEVSVQTMKNKQKEKVEEIIKEATSSTTAAAGDTVGTGPQDPTLSVASASSKTASTVETAAAKPAVVKKSLQTRIWEECVHYYHGFRLLFIDINVCRKLLWRVLQGKTLSRRENKLLVRTTSDVFRLIPFSVFIIVPFLELLLPVFIKLFPGMLPTTFQTAKEREDKLKQSLQVKLEMAKFLQKTLDEMAVQHKKEHKSEEARQFAEFFEKIKNPNEYVSSDEIIKYAKRFEDEITLDSLSRVQLAALCRLLELSTMGTTNFLRFQLRVKLRNLAADDRVIAREGVNALDLFELQQACKARGMRAYGLTAERLRFQLQEWIDLSLNEKVPPTLLLLSRAIMISDDKTTSHKLKETIRVLPDSVAAQTKVAIGEREGKIDNKTKIEIIKEEERKIKEERDEEREVAKAKAEIEATKPIIDPIDTVSCDPYAQNIATPKAKDIAAETAAIETISSKDAELLSDALKTLSSDSKMMVEKETIKDLKEELQDYKEDVEELCEVRNVVQEPVHESRAAKLLFKKVNKMIGNLDKVLADLETKQKKIQGETSDTKPETPEAVAAKRKEEELVRIDELVDTIKKLKQTSDTSRLKVIEGILEKLDTDKDGVITVNEVFKVVEAMSRENVNLNERQIEELLTLLDKEQLIEAEEKIEKAIAKSIKEAKRIEEDKKKCGASSLAMAMEKETMVMEKEAKAWTDAADWAEQAKSDSKPASKDELKDTAPVIQDKAKDLSLDEQKHVLKTEVKNKETETLLEAAEKHKEQLIPKTDISAAMPPTLPPTSTNAQANSEDKRI